MTISMDKRYVTRDGREVRIYAVDGGEDGRVHGAIQARFGWRIAEWHSDGRYLRSSEEARDLIEVKPKITRTYWLIHWLDYDNPSIGESREYLEKNYKLTRRRAITGPHTVEFTECDGL